MTVKIDQIADAIINAPGVQIVVSDGQPATSIPITSSDTKIMPEDEASMSFNAPVAGRYAVKFTFQINSTTWVTGQVKIVFDEGTADEQIVGYNEQWQVRVSQNQWATPVFFDTVELSAGDHTVTAYAKETAQDGWNLNGLDVSPQMPPTLILTFLSGSGAGGVLGDSQELTANQDISANWDSPAAIPNTPVSITVDCAEGEQIIAAYVATGWANNGACSGACYLYLDGSAIGKKVSATIANGYNHNFSDCVITEPLTAGSHTFEIYAGKYSTDPTWRIQPSGTALHVARFRGGLVPIQLNGTEIVGQPRALNFIGGGVYEVTEGYGANAGIANIELNQAITAPGISEQLLLDNPSGAETVTAAVYEDINTNFTDVSVNIPNDGTYLLQLKIRGVYSASTGSNVRFRILDGGTPITTDDETWETSISTIRESVVLTEPVELVSGDHTFTVQWQRVSGSGTPTVESYTIFEIRATMLTGSGAGGTLISFKQKTSDSTNLAVGSWHHLSELQHTFDASEDEEVILTWGVWVYTQYGGGNHALGYSFDGGTTIYPLSIKSVSPSYWDWNSGSKKIQVAAGSHTLGIYIQPAVANIDVKGGTSYGSSPAVTYNTYSELRQYRGGLVPIRDDSVTVVDKPAAIDFVGPNVQVTNQGGTAKVAYNGVAEGNIVTELPYVASTVLAAADTEYLVTSATIDCVEGENVQLDFRGWFFEGSTSGVFQARTRVYVNDVYAGEGAAVKDNTTALSDRFNASWSLALLGLSAGSNTIKLYAVTGVDHTNTNGELQAAYGTITQHRGGYVYPENVPVLSGVDGYLYEYVPAPGAANELRVTMSDGVRYKANAPVQMDLDSTGLGGREASASLVSGTWYYNYAVPDPDNSGYFDIIASDQHPGLGPTDYSAWRYLGAVYYINATSLLRKVSQAGSKFDYPDATDQTLWVYDSGGGGVTEVTPTADTWYSFSTSGASPAGGVQNDLRDAVPVSAVQADFSANMDTDSGEVYDLFIESGQVLYTPTITAATPGAFLSSDLSARDANRALVPLYNGDAYFRWGTQNAGPMGWLVSIRGYVDGYLTNLESQKQALYVPDSLLPRLTYAGASQIDVAARPGQPTVVKLTLQDEKERSFNGTLSFDPSLGAVDGGLDTGSEASSTWYYLYLVPKSGDDDFLVVRGSANAPYTGPSGYSNYRYIGAVYNNSSSDIWKFYHAGGRQFSLANVRSIQSQADPSSEASPVAVDVSGFTPATASHIALVAKGDNSVGTAVISWWADGDQTGTPFHRWWITDGMENIVSLVPMPTSTRQIWQQREDQSGANLINWELYTNGWIDGYLGQSSDAGNAHYGAQNLDQAYDGGRTITADAGPVIIDASGTDALELDGYLTLDEISDPTALGNAGIVYTKDLGGLTALFYRDDTGALSRLDGYSSVAADLAAHEADTGNPHSTDIGNLGSGTLAELNIAVTDATLFDRSELDGYAAVDHDATHIRGGSDEIDGDKLDIDWDPTNYVPTTDPPQVDNVDELTAHLAGIDGYIGATRNSLDGHLASIANPHDTTLDLAYDGSGSGAGRTITADSGPVFINAAGAAAAELDGYLALAEIDAPTKLSDTGLVYARETDSGTELHYMSDGGQATQVTRDGYVATDGYSGTVQITGTIAFVIANGLITSVIES